MHAFLRMRTGDIFNKDAHYMLVSSLYDEFRLSKHLTQLGLKKER